MMEQGGARSTGEDVHALAQVLNTAAISDACDAHGHWTSQLPNGIVRLTGEGTVVGWARTVVSRQDPAVTREYAQEIAFLDSLRADDVVVARSEVDGTGFWGELFSAAAIGRGARGAVIDGYIRDLDRIRPLGFPVHARGTHPGDCAGRISMQSVDEELRLGDAIVRSGDLVVADSDGTVVVPRDLVERVVSFAIDKQAREQRSLDALLNGATLAETWAQEGVL